LGPPLFFVLATVLMTWPLARDIRTAIVDHDDGLFGIWRMAWVAHQLPRAPRALFGANIFAPTPGTLALSDAALLQGLLAAPALWAGARPLLVYNVLLLGSLAASAWCAYVLALRLTGQREASLVAGFVFGFAPFRLAQLGHLEMQSTMWMPLAMLALHELTRGGARQDANRANGRSGVGAGIALGAVLALQALSGLYYLVFLTIVLGAMTAVLLVASGPAVRWRVFRGLAAAALVAAVVLVPYAQPYRSARALVGPRGQEEVAQFSATPRDYLRVGPGNWLHRTRIAPPPAEEHSLYPGIVAPALALVALWPPLSAWHVAAATGLAVAFDASLGTNGRLFWAGRQVVPALDGLRVPARFGVLVLLLLAVLAATGAARLGRTMGRSGSRWMAAIAIAVCAAEFWAVPIPLRRPVTEPTNLTGLLASLPPDTVVLHLPVPRTSRLWLHETTYQYFSIFHWRTLVNGYSGFAPPVYLRTLDALRTFPDAESIARLRRLGVGIVVVHPELFDGADYGTLAAAMEGSGAFQTVARLPGPPLESVVFRLTPAGESPGPDGRQSRPAGVP
jgi:hypothetical protein